jgi:hypothetical protein
MTVSESVRRVALGSRRKISKYFERTFHKPGPTVEQIHDLYSNNKSWDFKAALQNVLACHLTR